MTETATSAHFGVLAAREGAELPLGIYQSEAGFYIGTYRFDKSMGIDIPFTRESVAYWPSRELAATALRSGRWTQRNNI